MERKTDIEETGFEFVQPGEFDNPYYVYLLNGEVYGWIIYDGCIWTGTFKDSFGYSSGLFREIADKIDELNANLEAERKRFWGL